MAASTLFLPRGWQTQGGVYWAREYMCTNGYNFLWTATSPDGASSINVLPQERWETNNVNGQPSTPGCQSAPYTTTRQYLESMVQRWRPGARVLDYRVREDLQREYAQLNRSTPMPMGEARSWAEAGEILFAFTQSGADMRGSIAAVVMFSQTRMNSGAGMPVMEYRSGFALPAYGVTAPDGQLNLQFFEAIRRSHQAEPAMGAALERAQRGDRAGRARREPQARPDHRAIERRHRQDSRRRPGTRSKRAPIGARASSGS